MVMKKSVSALNVRLIGAGLLRGKLLGFQQAQALRQRGQHIGQFIRGARPHCETPRPKLSSGQAGQVCRARHKCSQGLATNGVWRPTPPRRVEIKMPAYGYLHGGAPAGREKPECHQPARGRCQHDGRNVEHDARKQRSNSSALMDFVAEKSSRARSRRRQICQNMFIVAGPAPTTTRWAICQGRYLSETAWAPRVKAQGRAIRRCVGGFVAASRVSGWRIMPSTSLVVRLSKPCRATPFPPRPASPLRNGGKARTRRYFSHRRVLPEAECAEFSQISRSPKGGWASHLRPQAAGWWKEGWQLRAVQAGKQDRQNVQLAEFGDKFAEDKQQEAE